VWSWWQDGSVHAQSWPTDTGTAGEASIIRPLTELLARVRRAKTESKLSQRAAVERLEVGAPGAVLDALRLAEGDLRDAGSITEVVYTDTDELTCTITLATSDAA
jgi:valyl-tRNA synthetase